VLRTRPESGGRQLVRRLVWHSVRKIHLYALQGELLFLSVPGVETPGLVLLSLQDNSLRDNRLITHRSSYRSGLSPSFPGFPVQSLLTIAHSLSNRGLGYRQEQDRLGRSIVWHWPSWSLSSLTSGLETGSPGTRSHQIRLPRGSVYSGFLTLVVNRL
jgi:hypothetical protein